MKGRPCSFVRARDGSEKMGELWCFCGRLMRLKYVCNCSSLYWGRCLGSMGICVCRAVGVACAMVEAVVKRSVVSQSGVVPVPDKNSRETELRRRAARAPALHDPAEATAGRGTGRVRVAIAMPTTCQRRDTACSLEAATVSINEAKVQVVPAGYSRVGPDNLG